MINQRIPKFVLSSIALAAAIVAGTPAAYAMGRPGAAPQDMGATPDATPITVSIILKLQNAEDLDAFIAASVDPGSNRYHKFLNVNQFRAKYAPSAFASPESPPARFRTSLIRSFFVSIA